MYVCVPKELGCDSERVGIICLIVYREKRIEQSKQNCGLLSWEFTMKKMLVL